jgi:hypothetical protein
MIKKILTLGIASFLTVLSYGQTCTPDISIKTHGYYPSELDSATEAVAYNMTMQVFSKRDTQVDNPFGAGKVNATIDSIIVNSVSGLPSGVSYACNPANCRFVSLKTHCINIFGTPPQGSSAYYPLDIKVTAKVTIGGSFPTTVNESVTNFGIFVKDDNISSVQTVSNYSVALYPNPAASYFNICNKRNVNGVVKVYSSTGVLVYEINIKEKEEIIVNSLKWPLAMYHIQVNYVDGVNTHANVLIK